MASLNPGIACVYIWNLVPLESSALGLWNFDQKMCVISRARCIFWHFGAATRKNGPRAREKVPKTSVPILPNLLWWQIGTISRRKVPIPKFSRSIHDDKFTQNLTNLWNIIEFYQNCQHVNCMKICQPFYENLSKFVLPFGAHCAGNSSIVDKIAETHSRTGILNPQTNRTCCKNERRANAATHSGLRLSPVDDHDDPLPPADDRLPFVGSSGPARRNGTTGLSPVVNSLTSTGDKSESTGDKIDANLSPVDDCCHRWSIVPTKCKYSRIWGSHVPTIAKVIINKIWCMFFFWGRRQTLLKISKSQRSL